MLMSLLMVCSMSVTPVFAAEVSDFSNVLEALGCSDMDTDVCEGSDAMQMMRATDYDLGTNGEKNLTISDFAAGAIRRSTYNYSTNTTSIYIKMKSDIPASVRVTLYDKSNNSQVGQQTVTVPRITSTTIRFSSLTSSKKYYMKYENLEQRTINITGKVSAN